MLCTRTDYYYYYQCKYNNLSNAIINVVQDEVRPTSFYVKGFAGLSVGTLVGQILFNFLVNAGMLLAAKTIHFEMLENLLMLPVRWGISYHNIYIYLLQIFALKDWFCYLRAKETLLTLNKNECLKGRIRKWGKNSETIKWNIRSLEAFGT